MTTKENEMSTTMITMSYEAAIATTVALQYERHEAIGRQASRMGPDKYDLGHDRWVVREEGWRLDGGYLAQLDEALAAIDHGRTQRYGDRGDFAIAG